jgi:hypothetical protein
MTWVAAIILTVVILWSLWPIVANRGQYVSTDDVLRWCVRETQAKGGSLLRSAPSIAKAMSNMIWRLVVEGKVSFYGVTRHDDTARQIPKHKLMGPAVSSDNLGSLIDADGTKYSKLRLSGRGASLATRQAARDATEFRFFAPVEEREGRGEERLRPKLDFCFD